MMYSSQNVFIKHFTTVTSALLTNSDARVHLLTAFKKQQKTRMPRVMRKAFCRIAARRLLNKSLQTRKENVGTLLKACRLIKSLQIEGKEDFGEDCHTASTEPHYYDAAYQLVKRNYTKKIPSKPETKDRKHPMKWECSCECKPLTETVDSIVSLRAAFENCNKKCNKI